MRPKITKVESKAMICEDSKNNVVFEYSLFFKLSDGLCRVDMSFHFRDKMIKEYLFLKEKLEKVKFYYNKAGVGRKIYYINGRYFTEIERHRFSKSELDNNQKDFFLDMKNELEYEIRKYEEIFESGFVRDLKCRYQENKISLFTQNSGWTEILNEKIVNVKVAFETSASPLHHSPFWKEKAELREEARNRAIKTLKKHTNYYRAVYF